MSDTTDDVPADPMDDPSLMPDPPTEPEAVNAAKQMNNPTGPQPGVVDNPPDATDDDPIPEIPE